MFGIEVFATYHKRKHCDSIEEWKTRRSNVFAKYGWTILYFDETELNEEHILEVLSVG